MTATNNLTNCIISACGQLFFKKSFTIYSKKEKTQARGLKRAIYLPEDYPLRKKYPYTCQLIDPQATIHHEFEHTMFGASKSKDGSLEEEVAACIFENAARILDSYEPRYVYFQRATGLTVSVFNFKVYKTGGYTFDKNDPRKLTLTGACKG